MVNIQSSCKITQTTTISFISGLRLKGKRNKAEYLSRYYDSGICPFRHINPLLTHTKNTYYSFVPQKHQDIALPAPQCSVENAYLLETKNENYSAF